MVDTYGSRLINELMLQNATDKTNSAKAWQNERKPGMMAGAKLEWMDPKRPNYRKEFPYTLENILSSASGLCAILFMPGL